MPSRPGEFHPEPLTDPDLNLSIHPARVIARRLPPSAEPSGSSRYHPVGPSSTAMTCPFAPRALPRFVTTTRQSAPLQRIGTFGLAVGAACAFSLGIAGQVLTFRTRARLSFAPPTCRMPLGPSQASPKLIPEDGSAPGFDIVYPETTQKLERLPRTQAAGVKLTSCPRSLMRLASLVTMQALSRLTRKSAPRSWWNVPFLSMW